MKIEKAERHEMQKRERERERESERRCKRGRGKREHILHPPYSH